jgi:hypothetical protein
MNSNYAPETFWETLAFLFWNRKFYASLDWQVETIEEASDKLTMMYKILKNKHIKTISIVMAVLLASVVIGMAVSLLFCVLTPTCDERLMNISKISYHDNQTIVQLYDAKSVCTAIGLDGMTFGNTTKANVFKCSNNVCSFENSYKNKYYDFQSLNLTIYCTLCLFLLTFTIMTVKLFLMLDNYKRKSIYITNKFTNINLV